MKFRRTYSLLALPLSFFFVHCSAQMAWGAAGQAGDGVSEARETADQQPASELTPRDLYKHCDRTLDTLRTSAHGLVREAQVKYVDLNEIRETQKQTRERFNNLLKNQGQLYNQLSAEQLHGVYKRTHQLEVWRGRFENYLNTIDEIVAAPKVDHHRLIEQSRLAERAIRAYQLHFHELGNELAIDGE